MESSVLENVVAVVRHVGLLPGIKRLGEMHRGIHAKCRACGGGIFAAA